MRWRKSKVHLGSVMFLWLWVFCLTAGAHPSTVDVRPGEYPPPVAGGSLRLLPKQIPQAWPLQKDTLRQVMFNRPPQLLEGELIPLRLTVDRKLNVDLDAFYYRDRLYLPARYLFTSFKIENYLHQGKLTVHFPDSEKPIHFYPEQQFFKVSGTLLPFTSDQIFHSSGELYILTELLENLFGFTIEFDYRKLSITLSSPQKLPALAVLERKERYQQFVSPAPGIAPDVRLSPRHPLFDGWTADWSVSSTHGPLTHSSAARVQMGGQLLGGELSFTGAGAIQHGLQAQQLKGRWRLPVYSTPALRQVQVGNLTHSNRIGLEPTAFRGLMLTNRPPAPRQNFSNYIFEGALAHGEDVEFHFNNRLSSLALGDHSRYYRFGAPLEYGSNIIQLKHYGMDGALNRHDRYVIYIPPDFLPPGKVEYSLSAGTYTTGTDDNFGRLSLKWGLSPYLTLGGGSLITGSGSGRQSLPFVQSWARLGNRFIVTATHTYLEMTESSLSSSFWGAKQLSLQVRKHHTSSLFNRTGKDLEASFSTSFPVAVPPASLHPFIHSRYTQYDSGNQTTHLSGGFTTRLPLNIRWRMNSRFMLLNHASSSYNRSRLNLETQLSRRMMRRLLLRPMLAYDYHLRKLSSFELQLISRISSNYHLEFRFQRNNLVRNNQLMVSFRTDLPFARHQATMRTTGRTASLYQYTSGSIAFRDRWRSLQLNNQRRTGRGGLALQAYLDYNHNSQKDYGEPIIEGITADLYRPGHHQPFSRGQHLFDNLIPYGEYIVKVDPSSFRNPLWVLKHSSYSVQVLPNTFTTLGVPVWVSGEVNGFIEAELSPHLSLEGINIDLYSAQGDFVKTLTTYRGGKFYSIGLKPGSYRMFIDQDQLAPFNLTIVDDTLNFTIKAVEEGDIVDGLIFKAIPIPSTALQPDQVIK